MCLHVSVIHGTVFLIEIFIFGLALLFFFVRLNIWAATKSEVRETDMLL